ncbi:hypothetical protein GGTG_10869 [Gaeumannomyces tritici R3-111a-1]|uniref:Uncharacterized protein n=1 Tax=Gaeumannomyces tritici (strain R3-111a-1) TaxID=644352 RepID=J3PBJ7_GAET3|nr:hypothetical protein GGTG_10869 [Gaeumannomyces tritici R3-111a-1]EJT71614.1 hypothetical protein GGTG_10869 [Gaeumannomyces tritici R3-111a-1]
MEGGPPSWPSLHEHSDLSPQHPGACYFCLLSLKHDTEPSLAVFTDPKQCGRVLLPRRARPMAVGDGTVGSQGA